MSGPCKAYTWSLHGAYLVRPIPGAYIALSLELRGRWHTRFPVPEGRGLAARHLGCRILSREPGRAKGEVRKKRIKGMLKGIIRTHVSLF